MEKKNKEIHRLLNKVLEYNALAGTGKGIDVKVTKEPIFLTINDFGEKRRVGSIDPQPLIVEVEREIEKLLDSASESTK